MHKMHKIYMNTHSRVEITLCRWAIQKRPACNACALVVCAVMVEAVEDGGRKNVLIKFLTRRARANRGGTSICVTGLLVCILGCLTAG